jgi:hypothetical protein
MKTPTALVHAVARPAGERRGRSHPRPIAATAS